MRTIGVLLVGVAVLMGLWAVGMDNSVAAMDGGRIVNMGLMAQQVTRAIMAVILAVAGAAFMVVGTLDDHARERSRRPG